MVAPSSDAGPIPPPGRRGTAEVRGALMQSAARLFARKGYGGTSTKEIATAARTSEATIYRQFGSKADLFSAAVAEPFSSFLAEYQEFFREAMYEDDWSDQLISERSVERLYHYLHENKDAVLAMFFAYDDSASAEPAERAVDQLNVFFASLHAIGVERWRRDPTSFDIARLPMVHRLLVAMIFCVSALDRWFVPRDPDRPTEREIITAITRLLIHGLVEHAHGRGDGEARVSDGGTHLLDQLERLVKMKKSGMLTDGEFAVAKRFLFDSR